METILYLTKKGYVHLLLEVVFYTEMVAIGEYH